MAEEEDLTIDADDPEADMDSLMSEMEGQKDSPSEPSRSGDLSSLVTATVDPSEVKIDSMLDSATQDSMTLIDDSEEGEGMNLEFLLQMPLNVTFEVGRAKMTIADLLSLGQGSVLELHRLVGENLDMFVNGKLIAHGEVVVVNEKFGARLVDIIPPEERIKQMGKMDHTS